MNTQTFETYVQRVLAPTLPPGNVVLLDNLSVHKGERIRAMIRARGTRLEFLPPYSPDLNPMEKCWAKIKEACAGRRGALGRRCSPHWARLALCHAD